jgi:hypothetical protein
MESLGLTRRSRQLELLARACARGEPAQIRPRHGLAPAGTENTALLALEDDGLLLYWPEHAKTDTTVAGTELDVSFSVDGRSFRFRSASHGRVQRRLNARGRVSALKVGLPLRIEPAQRRRAPRFSLEPLDLPAAALTPVVDRDQRLNVRVVELSGQHVRAAAAAGLRDLLIAGTHHWLEIPLSGDASPVELIVRLTQIGTMSRGASAGDLSLNFTICPGDDGARVVDALERIGRNLTEHRQDAGPGAVLKLEGARC